jgi:methionyl-tRNA formyltransferase
MSLKVFISGQKYFGAEVFRLCKHELGLDIVGVCCPAHATGKPDRLYEVARRFEVPIIPAGTLTADTMPAGVDLGIAAHSFDYVGRATRYKARLGWIGYHPSLLPRHRGRDAVRWSIKMNDAITGGTVYWLNSGIDRGDIAEQDWCFISKQDTPESLWREKLCPIGLQLFGKVLKDIINGNSHRLPQDEQYATFEPGIGGHQIYKPDLLMLPNKIDESLA